MEWTSWLSFNFDHSFDLYVFHEYFVLNHTEDLMQGSFVLQSGIQIIDTKKYTSFIPKRHH